MLKRWRLLAGLARAGPEAPGRGHRQSSALPARWAGRQQRKAALLLLCEELEAAHPRLSYFPAYEILIDELRLYRYFERDMVHSNALAVDLVWERFARTYLEPETWPRLADMDRLLKPR